jgi:hypothetical protein
MHGKQPAPDDVIIAPDAVSGRGFTLSIGPAGLSQLWYASYDEALKKALAWASSSGVVVWRVDGAARFIPVSLPETPEFSKGRRYAL